MRSLLRAFGRRRRLHWRRLGRERLGWTVRVRSAVIALFLAVAIAARVIGVLPSLVPALLAAAAGALMNLLAARRVARWERIPAMLVWTGLGDALLITYVVAATGGTASPFLLLYVVQVLTTALVVDVVLGAVMGMGSVVLLAAAVVRRAPQAAPAALAADMVGERWIWLSSLGVTLLCLVFLGGHLTRRLARSERELASTHRRLSRSLRRLTETHASLRDAYERLARAEAELIETDRLQTLQVLVAGLAHELGNPLTVLAGNMEPLGESLAAFEAALDADEGGEARVSARLVDARREAPALLANCIEATRRAVALLGQLRDFGRGGRGTVRRLASLAPGLVGTLALLRYRLPAGVTVHESYANVPDVACVPAELNQVFINLLMNAIDAIAPGGQLWLSLAHDGADVLVRVRDDGAGIAPAVLPHIFEPFVTTKDAGHGTGLGLAISHAIVTRHHGRIEVETAAGQGTTFTVRLPVPDAGAPPLVPR